MGADIVIEEPEATPYNDLNDWGTYALSLQEEIDNSLPLRETTWIGTHNSFANNDDDKFNSAFKNQPLSISNQLNFGIRQMTLDVHATRETVFDAWKVRVCHNNLEFPSAVESWKCIDGTTGRRRLGDVFADIRDWLIQNPTSVLLINLDLMSSIRSRTGKLEDVINDKIKNYVYSPTNDFGGTPGDNCVNLDVAQITKNMVLAKSKNIILYSKHGCDDKIKHFIFDLGGNDDIICDFNNPSDVDSFTDQNKMKRVKDGATFSKQKLLNLYSFGGHDNIKLHRNNVDDYFKAGLNIFETYGFKGSDSWSNNNEKVLHPPDCVWSWDQYYPNRGTWQNCAIYYVNSKKYRSNGCNDKYSFACTTITNGGYSWKVTTGKDTFFEGDTKCKSEFGNSYKFAMPKNPKQLAALSQLNKECWINYKLSGDGWVAAGNQMYYYGLIILIILLIINLLCLIYSNCIKPMIKRIGRGNKKIKYSKVDMIASSDDDMTNLKRIEI